MDVEKILSTAFLVPLDDPMDLTCTWGLNVILWGAPGIGKSDRVEQAGLIAGLPVRTTYAPTTQPEDVAGTAFMNTSKGTAMLESVLGALELGHDPNHGYSGYMPRVLQGSLMKGMVQEALKTARRYGGSFSRIEPLLPGLSDLMIDRQGVWFIDELSSARPAVQAAYLGATLARRVGGIRLPAGIRVVAAANPADCAAGGWELEAPMANRFCHFTVPVPSTSSWGSWLVSGRGTRFKSIEDGEDVVRKNWRIHWPIISGMVAGFMQTKGAPLHELPPDGSPERGLAWSSPRTWWFGARAWATCRCLYGELTADGSISYATADDIAMEFMEGCVGSASAVSIRSWAKNIDLPDPVTTLTKGWTPDKHRIDRNFAVYAAMVAYVVSRTDKKERFELAVPAWTRIQESADAKLYDITLFAAESLVSAGLDQTASKSIEKVAQPVMALIAKKGLGKFVGVTP